MYNKIHTDRKDELLQAINKVKLFLNSQRGKSSFVEAMANNALMLEKEMDDMLENVPKPVQPWMFRITRDGGESWYVSAAQLKGSFCVTGRTIEKTGYLHGDGEVRSYCGSEGRFSRFVDAQQAIISYYAIHYFI